MNKKLMSAVMAGAMTLAMAVPAFAEDKTTTIGGTVSKPSDDYVLTIPTGNTDLDLGITTQQEIGGKLKVDPKEGKTFTSEKKVTVTIGSTNKGMLKNTNSLISTNNTLTYALYIGSNVETSWETNPTVNFSADDINSTVEDKGVDMTVQMTETTADKDVEDGTYQDVLTFSAALQSVVSYTVTNSPSATTPTLAFSDIGEADAATLTVSGITYTVYKSDDFIAKTAGWNWDDAMNFVKALNDVNYDGHNNWSLLPYSNAAADRTAISNCLSRRSCGVFAYWSNGTLDDGSGKVYHWNCDSKLWNPNYKTGGSWVEGFIVVRPQD